MCSLPSHKQFSLSHVSLLPAPNVAGNQISSNRADDPPWRIRLSRGVMIIWRYMPSTLLRRRRRGLTTRSVSRSTSYRTVEFVHQRSVPRSCDSVTRHTGENIVVANQSVD
ncbi:hypothetical protein THAOC_03007 [Thalassiosira oceanica]|uniref:Uncharacterized protein n=1 Tax=Thalassiosira oceanica TaxID=159749 RepID=K0TDS9_THAOC|nr:hypothetical protein THAOC_03007 [Thalassiosira oceanica]|eukprot:EJK75274.1 hypothetical protein THAOC_03007 [Thalassiosira oceanica]